MTKLPAVRNLQMGYERKLLKHGVAGQQCKKHMPIGLVGNMLSCLSNLH